jgi:hypothetical protein
MTTITILFSAIFRPVYDDLSGEKSFSFKKPVKPVYNEKSSLFLCAI